MPARIPKTPPQAVAWVWSCRPTAFFRKRRSHISEQAGWPHLNFAGPITSAKSKPLPATAAQQSLPSSRLCISTRTASGSIGILANHEPVLAMLDPTELRLYKPESECV